MKHRRYLVVALILIVLCIFLFFISLINHATPDTNSDVFYQIVEDIQDSFVFGEYEEIMNEKTHMLGLPLEYDLVNENDDMLGRQKLFVFKSTNAEAIILLQITQTKSTENEWNSSLNYDSDIFNAENSKYGDFYNQGIPDIEVAFNAFTYRGCHYSTICVSGKSDTDYAASELIGFSNELIKFISK